MKNKIIFFSFIIIAVSCHKNESIKNPIPSNDKKGIVNDLKKTEKPQEVNYSKTCSDEAIEILESSSSYQKRIENLLDAVVKNGGTSYGILIEGSPNPKSDHASSYSKNYDFSLHETYPDRVVTIARYTFDPARNELFEYDVVNDSMITIKFDKKLLSKFHKTCN
jgi:hypothetical protein